MKIQSLPMPGLVAGPILAGRAFGPNRRQAEIESLREKVHERKKLRVNLSF